MKNFHQDFIEFPGFVCASFTLSAFMEAKCRQLEKKMKEKYSLDI
jgi:hypothetical protein